MSDRSTARAPAGAPQPADGHRGLRLLALAAVSAGVLLLAAAAFVLSYSGIHAVALSAGVSPRLARIYPVVLDAMLVVACAAVLSLRGAGLPSRSYAWLSMLVLLAAGAAASALHATGTRLPHRPAAAAAAIIPWVLVLIGFGLLLCMLRQGRLRRAAAATPEPDPAPEAPGHVTLRPGADTRPPPGAPPPESPAPPAPGPPRPDASSAERIAPRIPRQAGPGAESSLRAAPSALAPAPTVEHAERHGPDPVADDDAAYLEPGSEDDPGLDAEPTPAADAEPTPGADADPDGEADPDDPEPGAGLRPSPQFDRMRSSPIPPSEE